MARLAQTVLDYYRFPVESMVLFSNGSLISRLNANDLMDDDSKTTVQDGFEDNLIMTYYKFLSDSLEPSPSSS